MKVLHIFLLLSLPLVLLSSIRAEEKPDPSKIDAAALRIILKDRQEHVRWDGINPWGVLEYRSDQAVGLKELIPVVSNRASNLTRDTPDLGIPFGLAPAHAPFPEVRFHTKDVLHLKNLVFLDLTGVRVDHNDLKELAKIPKLQTLFFEDGSDSLYGAISGCENLTRLFCRVNIRVTPKGVPTLAKFKNLQSLSMANAQMLNDDDLKEIAKLKTLTHLDISYNQTFTNAGLKHLTQLVDLEHLNLMYAQQATGAALKDLKALKNLRSLDLSHLKNLEEGLPELKDYTNLRALRIRGGLTDAGLKTLAELKDLEYLDIRGGSSNRIGDEALQQFQKAVPKCQVRK